MYFLLGEIEACEGDDDGGEDGEVYHVGMQTLRRNIRRLRIFATEPSEQWEGGGTIGCTL
jgi:hypothetical protein